MYDDSNELLAISEPFVRMLTHSPYGSHLPYTCHNCRSPSDYGMLMNQPRYPLYSSDEHQHKLHESEFKNVLELGAFKPENIKINIVGHLLTVRGERNEKADNFECTANFTRTFRLPKGIDPDSISCHLLDGNKLEILGVQKGWKRSINIPIETDDMRKRLASDATRHGFEKIEHEPKRMQLAEIPGETAHEIPIQKK
ncbi:unnamed protein product, partial [Mesorhabditis belari]|uniref:SHSP domain-containing protein n=1 Tax=Mesorhabditis belari TaxID=2138241 RepID=A0AAF3EEW4_9BILA